MSESLLVNQVICGDSAIELKNIPSDYIPLTVTSPPYDNLRDYNKYTFDFESIAKELYRITKPGGVVVWVVNDATINGSETGTSFKQALFFKQIGFNLHDTMIYEKSGCSISTDNRYYSCFEYMFILSKGKPLIFNPIKDRKNRFPERWGNGKKIRDKNGEFTRIKTQKPKPFGVRFNIWRFVNGGQGYNTNDEIAHQHPAIFPEALAKDHIISWSNEGDLILDPFAGSGTTLKMAKLHRRNYLGIEISQEYCDLIRKRLDKYNNHSLDSLCVTVEKEGSLK